MLEYRLRYTLPPLLAGFGFLWMTVQVYRNDYMEFRTALMFWTALALGVWTLRWSTYGGALSRGMGWVVCTAMAVQAIIGAMFMVGLFPAAVMTAAARGFAMFGPYDGCGWTMWSCYVAPATAMFFPVRFFIDDWRFRFWLGN